MHQAQPKEGHKIWLTQEADAKSWSSLKHVQPKEGRKELAPREIKFRYRRLDTTIRERAGSSQVPREAQESEIYPGLLFFVSFFSSLGFFCSAPQDFGMLGVFCARFPPREASYQSTHDERM